MKTSEINLTKVSITDTDTIVGILPLKRKKNTMVTEIIWNCFRIIVLLADPWFMAETELSDTGQYFTAEYLNSLEIHCTLHRLVWSDTDVSWPWCSPLISMDIVCICIIRLSSFSLGATSRDVGNNLKNLKPQNNMCNCSHRNIGLLGRGLIAFNMPFNSLSLAFCGHI